MRVALGGLFHESNTFCPALTDLHAFRTRQFDTGDGLRAAYREAHHEVGGFLAAADELGLEVVPTVYAGAMPAGAVTDEAFEWLLDHLLRGLASARAEGVYLPLHGAMVTQSCSDAEGEIVERARELVGPDVPIVVSLDYHANVSERMVTHSDATVVYRTYPHIDQRQRGEEAARLLAGALSGKWRLVQALAAPPLILNLKAQETGVEPMRSVLAHADEIAGRDGILSVSVAGGFPYADIPEMGTTAVVVADGDADLARSAADELGALLWSIRDQTLLELPDAAEAVRQAMQPGPTPVALVDFGDNVGGGSAADGTLLLRELLSQGADGGVVTLFAPQAVKQCLAAGVNGQVPLKVGGTCDDGQGPAVEVNARVRSLHDGNYIEPAPRHGGVRFNAQGVTAVVEVPGPNLVVLTSHRTSPNSLRQLTSLGIEPDLQRILVVKAAIAYKAAYEPVAGRIIEVDTPGYTAVDPARFEYQHRRRPMFPFERDAGWP